MNKQEVYDFLTSRGIEYEVTEHGAVFNMEEMSHVELPHQERTRRTYLSETTRSAIIIS